jgi:hypothetical protein
MDRVLDETSISTLSHKNNSKLMQKSSRLYHYSEESALFSCPSRKSLQFDTCADYIPVLIIDFDLNISQEVAFILLTNWLF